MAHFLQMRTVARLGTTLSFMVLVLTGCSAPGVLLDPVTVSRQLNLELAVPEAEQTTLTQTPLQSDNYNHALIVESQLRQTERVWHGTPYRFGGTSQRGVDCSGFVQAVFLDLFEYQLPRSTRGQVKVGLEVDTDELQAGDLIFFRPRGRRHVGVYLGDGEFAHASSSRGVMISQLDEPYWRKAYWTARRVLTDLTPMQTSEAALSPPTRPVSEIASPQTGVRSGW